MKNAKKTAADTQQKYPWLVKKQKTSTVIERRVRRFLNQQTPEGDENARQLLSTISSDKRSAEYYFLSGCLRHRMGHMTDAMAYLDRACEMAQGKIPEYETIRNSLKLDAEPTPEVLENFADFESGDIYRPRPAFVFWNFMGECCAEGCMECTCDACCEGCGEGCCEGCCEGCSCDC